jgi:hypothetical protein
MVNIRFFIFASFIFAIVFFDCIKTQAQVSPQYLSESEANDFGLSGGIPSQGAIPYNRALIINACRETVNADKHQIGYNGRLEKFVPENSSGHRVTTVRVADQNYIVRGGERYLIVAYGGRHVLRIIRRRN